MIRITRETDYGIVLMTFMARNSGEPHSAAHLAERHNLSLPMVSKILKALAKGGLLVSQRGVKGGYSLARKPQQISVVEIIDALEGPIAITECTHGEPSECVHQDYCGVSNHWSRINDAIRKALENISLWEMSRPRAVAVSLMNMGGTRAEDRQTVLKN